MSSYKTVGPALSSTVTNGRLFLSPFRSLTMPAASRIGCQAVPISVDTLAVDSLHQLLLFLPYTNG